MLAPPADILAQMNASIPRGLRLFIGVAEVAAALGLKPRHRCEQTS